MWVFINVGAKTLEAMGTVVLGSGMGDNEKREREGCNMLWGVYDKSTRTVISDR
jgi:hypothetical protein